MHMGVLPEDVPRPKSILRRASEHQPKRLQKKTLRWKAIDEVRLISSCLDPELQDSYYYSDVKHPNLHLIADIMDPDRMTKLRQNNLIIRQRKLLGIKRQKQRPSMTQNSSIKRKRETEDLPDVQPKRQAIESQTSCARTRPLVRTPTGCARTRPLERTTTSLHSAKNALVKVTPPLPTATN
jgi:hypothetical protein